MKKEIATLLDSYVNDNEEYIKESGGNVADYILWNAELMDFGWLWFLTEDETEAFENDPVRRDELIQEIRDYVNENYK
jgi:hypothetical protein